MIQPIIAITGQPIWTQPAVDLLLRNGCTALPLLDPALYIDQLVDGHVMLALVDGDDPNWRFWVITPKTEQATRRIPLVVVTPDAEIGHAAIQAGATMWLKSDEVSDQLAIVVRQYARIPDPDRLAQLACQCHQTLPPLARQAIEKFNAGAYYAQHDAFEEQWMQESGPVRDLYQGILQVGVAYYHIQRGNIRGGLKMLRRSVQWLAYMPDVCQGVDVRQLRDDAARVRAALAALDPTNPAPFDRSLVRPVRLVEHS
jgi:predicted metal-dependent hydrolase